MTEGDSWPGGPRVNVCRAGGVLDVIVPAVDRQDGGVGLAVEDVGVQEAEHIQHRNGSGDLSRRASGVWYATWRGPAVHMAAEWGALSAARWVGHRATYAGGSGFRH